MSSCYINGTLLGLSAATRGVSATATLSYYLLKFMLFYWCSCINTRAELLNQVTLEDETSTPQRRQGYIRHLDGLL